MLDGNPYHIYSLGDSAVTLDLGNVIDRKLNRKVLAIHELLSKNRFPGICELVAGYSTITILYDAFSVSKLNNIRTPAHEFVRVKLEQAFHDSPDSIETDTNIIDVPVCYEEEFAKDLHFVSRATGLTTQEIVRIHTSQVFYVFMIGFIPGFAYMGELDERLQLPRKEKPELVVAGSVGIASGQTGIYPLDSPGGWQIIGRTPLQLFNKDARKPVLFSPGQLVQFQSISKREFEKWRSPS